MVSHYAIDRRRFRRVRYWVVPVIYAAAALLAGLLIPRIEFRIHANLSLSVSVASATAVLSSIASGMMALTAIVFSLVFVVVQFASTAYSPRLVVLLARSSIIRHSLGIFTGTFLYALMALAAVDEHGSGVVPAITTLVALLWLLGSIAALILLISRVTSLYISSVLDGIGQSGRKVISEMYVAQGDDDVEPVYLTSSNQPWEEMEVTQTVVYYGGPLALAALDMPRLVNLARQAGALIEITYAIGDTVVDGAPLARVRHGLRSSDEQKIRDAMILLSERTVEQDPKYAIRLLVDVAIRALSPAVNDPTTAVMALNQIEDLLRRLGHCHLNSGRETDRNGLLRLVYPTPNWEDFLDLALLEIMYYGANSIQVMRRMAAMLDDLEQAVPPKRGPAVRYYTNILQSTVEHSFQEAELRQEAHTLDRQGLGVARVDREGVVEAEAEEESEEDGATRAS